MAVRHRVGTAGTPELKSGRAGLQDRAATWLLETVRDSWDIAGGNMDNDLTKQNRKANIFQR